MRRRRARVYGSNPGFGIPSSDRTSRATSRCRPTPTEDVPQVPSDRGLAVAGLDRDFTGRPAVDQQHRYFALGGVRPILSAMNRGDLLQLGDAWSCECICAGRQDGMHQARRRKHGQQGNVIPPRRRNPAFRGKLLATLLGYQCSMYRILAALASARTAPHPHCTGPGLLATAPNPTWSLDIERREVLLNLAVMGGPRHPLVAAGRSKPRAA